MDTIDEIIAATIRKRSPECIFVPDALRVIREDIRAQTGDNFTPESFLVAAVAAFRRAEIYCSREHA